MSAPPSAQQQQQPPAKRAREEASPEEQRIEAAFAALEQSLKDLDEKREAVIKRSRDVQKASKQAIYALHRLDFKRADELIATCENVLGKELIPAVEKDPELRYGSVANCCEEYAEAVIFKNYLLKPDLWLPMTKDEIPLSLSPDEYLGGLFDATGEIQRHAVVQATKRDVRTAERARSYVDFVMGRAQQFDFRNGNLRKKSDTIKWTLKRLEEVLFDLSLGHRPSVEQPPGPPATSSDAPGAD